MIPLLYSRIPLTRPSAKELQGWLDDHPEVASDVRPVPTPTRQENSVPLVGASPAPTVADPQDSDVEVVVDSSGRQELWQDAQSQKYPGEGDESDEGEHDKDDKSVAVPEATRVPPVQSQPPEEQASHRDDDQESLEDWDIPSVDDVEAPRPQVGQHTLTPNAIRQRAKRIFTKRVDGSMKVSETIFQEWKSKGAARKNLETIFRSVGYDPDSCLCFVHFPLLVGNSFKLSLVVIGALNHFDLPYGICIPKDTFCAEVEILRQEMQSTKLTIEGEYLSHTAMVDKGLSEYFGIK